jgi:hypothetical protein
VPFVLAAAGLLSHLLASTTFDPRINPHSRFGRASECPKCHIVRGTNVDPDRFLAECSDYCLGCHSSSQLGRSHPIGTRPKDKYWKMKVPEDFRLDDDGRMMCLTCHRGHGPFLATVKAFERQRPENLKPPQGIPEYYKTYFARLSDPVRGFATLCDACHKLL